MNKTQMIIAPILILGFVIILAVMYGWVDTMAPVGGEAPEVNPVNLQTRNNPANNPEQLVNKPRISTGIGNGRIQLVNKPTFPSGIGNGQIQLINNPTFPTGIGNGQIQLINQTLPGAPYTGITVGEVPQLVAKDLNLAPGTGVYVKNVISHSPADKTGIKQGDVVLKFDHKTVASHEQIGRIVRTKKVNDVIKVLVNRDGRKKSFHVKLEKAPKGLVQAAATQKKKIWLGADIQDIDAVMKKQFSLPDKRGVIVSHVTANSPAHRAGLLTGDVIRRFKGKRIRDVKQLQSLILEQPHGKQVQIVVLRNQEQFPLSLVLGEHTPAAPKIPFLGPADIAIEGSWIGMDVGELTANGAASFGLPSGTRGIVVNDVESPPATTVGFQTGDVIMAVNGEPTPDMKRFQKATKKQQRAVVDIIRGNKHFFISVPAPGFTQQGTKINTGPGNKTKTVALTQPAIMPGQKVFNRRLGIFSSGPDIHSPVIGNSTQTPYLIMVDLDTNSFAVMDPKSLGNLANTFRQNNLSALVCSSVSRQTQTDLQAGGVSIYSGVVGTINRAIGLYESGCLTPTKR